MTKYVLKSDDVYFAGGSGKFNSLTADIDQATKFDLERAHGLLGWLNSDEVAWIALPVEVEYTEPKKAVYEQLTKEELLLLLINSGTATPGLDRAIELVTENVILQDNLEEVINKVVMLSGPF
jgi:hypothetical protein